LVKKQADDGFGEQAGKVATDGQQHL